jgi:hypothetical protein
MAMTMTMMMMMMMILYRRSSRGSSLGLVCFHPFLLFFWYNGFPQELSDKLVWWKIK